MQIKGKFRICSLGLVKTFFAGLAPEGFDFQRCGGGDPRGPRKAHFLVLGAVGGVVGLVAGVIVVSKEALELLQAEVEVGVPPRDDLPLLALAVLPLVNVKIL